jgi:hypothetical protein
MQIFISYSRIDKEFALQLAQFLHAYEVTVWLDLSSIPHGANWDMEVQRGLDTSDYMLVLLSPDSVASGNVADEWNYFASKEKPILPLLIRPCEVPFRLMRRQRVDFTGDQRTALEQLVRALGNPKLRDPDETQRLTVLPVVPAGQAAAPAHGGKTGKRKTSSAEIARFPVIWNGQYDWFNGLRGGTDGELMVNRREVLLVPREAPLLSIPLATLTSAKVQNGLDPRLLLNYRGADGHTHSITVMSATRRQRKQIPDQIVQAIKAVTGRDDL